MVFSRDIFSNAKFLLLPKRTIRILNTKDHKSGHPYTNTDCNLLTRTSFTLFTVPIILELRSNVFIYHDTSRSKSTLELFILTD